MTHSQDHFSTIATAYNDGRIAYSTPLYEYLSRLCKEKLAWDCATGSGQAVKDLSTYFDRVIATDISESLLSQADSISNVEFRKASAEHSEIGSTSMDLVVVAQAVHWFEQEKFWNEVRRLLKPNGILALWGYVWPLVDDRIDNLLGEFRESIEKYWPEKSRYLHDFYADIEAPFQRVDMPDFRIVERWTASDYLAHLASWSGTRYCAERSKIDPLSKISDYLLQAWGDALRTVEWPLLLKVYRKAEQDSDSNG